MLQQAPPLLLGEFILAQFEMLQQACPWCTLSLGLN